MLFRKAVSAVMLVGYLSGSVGCSTWISNFKKDPLTQIQNIIQGVEMAVGLATVIFGQVEPNLPPDTQKQAQAEWNQAVLRVNTTAAALQAALKVAVDADQTNPDFGKLIDDVASALDALKDVVDKYKANPTMKTAAMAKPMGYDAMVNQMALVKSQMPRLKAATSH